MTRQTIARNTFLYTLVYFLPFLTSFITMPIVTSSLTSSEYGVLSVSENFADILVIFVSLQMSNAIPRLIHDYGQDKKGFFSTILYSSTALSFFVVGLIILFSGFIYSTFLPHTPEEYHHVISFSLLNMCLNLCLRTNELFWIGNGRGQMVITKSVIQLISKVILLYVLLRFMNMGLDGVMWSNTISILISLGFALFVNHEYLGLSFEKKILKEVLHFSLPIIPQSIGSFLFMYSDVFVMEKFVSLSAIGLYSIANRFSNILKMFVNAVNDANQFHIFKVLTNKESTPSELINECLRNNLILSTLGYMSICMFAPELLYFLAPPRYFPANEFIVILSASFILRSVYNAYMTNMAYRKEMKWFSAITLSCGVLNLVLNLALLPKFGAISAAYTTVLSFGFTALLAYLINRKHIHWERENWAFIAMSGVMVSIGLIFNYVMLEDTVFRISLKIVSVLTVLVFLKLTKFFDVITYLKNIKKG